MDKRQCIEGQRASISIDGAKKRKCEDEEEDQPDVKKNEHMAKQRQKPRMNVHEEAAKKR